MNKLPNWKYAYINAMKENAKLKKALENQTLIRRLQKLSEKENCIINISFDGRIGRIVSMVVGVRHKFKAVNEAYDYHELENVHLFNANPECDDYVVEIFENLIEKVKHCETEEDKNGV